MSASLPLLPPHAQRSSPEQVSQVAELLSLGCRTASEYMITPTALFLPWIHLLLVGVVQQVAIGCPDWDGTNLHSTPSPNWGKTGVFPSQALAYAKQKYTNTKFIGSVLFALVRTITFPATSVNYLPCDLVLVFLSLSNCKLTSWSLYCSVRWINIVDM